MDPSKQAQDFQVNWMSLWRRKNLPDCLHLLFSRNMAIALYFQRIISDEMMIIARTFCSAWCMDYKQGELEHCFSFLKIQITFFAVSFTKLAIVPLTPRLPSFLPHVTPLFPPQSSFSLPLIACLSLRSFSSLPPFTSQWTRAPTPSQSHHLLPNFLPSTL